MGRKPLTPEQKLRSRARKTELQRRRREGQLQAKKHAAEIEIGAAQKT